MTSDIPASVATMATGKPGWLTIRVIEWRVIEWELAVGCDIVGLVPNQACVHGSGIPFPTALLRLSRCVERLSR